MSAYLNRALYETYGATLGANVSFLFFFNEVWKVRKHLFHVPAKTAAYSILRRVKSDIVIKLGKNTSDVDCINYWQW